MEHVTYGLCLTAQNKVDGTQQSSCSYSNFGCNFDAPFAIRLGAV